MRYRVLIDSNVALDFLLTRTGFTENAEIIFKAIEEKSLVGCISSSAMTDIYYIVESNANSDFALEMIEYLYRTVRILPVFRKTVRTALDSGMKDFEDVVQVTAAKDDGIDIVVTRDPMGSVCQKGASPHAFQLKDSPVTEH